ncbi:hypothetical protein D3C87_33270 [compost metagenome]
MLLWRPLTEMSFVHASQNYRRIEPNMLNNLYRLYKSNRLKSPLEDFTTEVFAGILKFDPSLLNDFCVDFLGLQKEPFVLRTQVKYPLKNDIDCIVDMVIESQNQVCFIENKVDSKEGFRQLERYSKVLDKLQSQGKSTYLVFCTKNAEEKTITEHQFKQIRWFQVAKFVEKHPSESAIKKDFLLFLKLKKMSQDLTITKTNTFVTENIFETIHLINGHLDRIKPSFEKAFNKNGAKKISDGFNITQILKHKRLIYYFKEILGNTPDGWSEIKYGFQLNSLKIYCGIWIDHQNSKHNDLKQHILKNESVFGLIDLPNGFALELSESLATYLDDPDGDERILNWFKEAFGKFQKLIEDTKDLSWKLDISDNSLIKEISNS